MKLMIIAKIRETHTRFLQPMRSECKQANLLELYRFGIFGWYPVGISRYFTIRYQRQTWLVHFGIKKMAGAFLYTKKGFVRPGMLTKYTAGKVLSTLAEQD